MLAVPLLLLVGVLLAPRIGSDDPLDRSAFGLLAAMAAAPLLAVTVAWATDTPLGATSVALCAAVVVAASVPGWRARYPALPWTRRHVAVLAGACIVGGVTAVHHSDAELLLAAASWLERGEAECFYMQTFALVNELAGPAAATGVRDAWSIIAVPSNAVFTAPLLPMLDDATFRVVDALTRGLTFTWIAALLLRAHGSLPLALGVAAAALLNPYVLSVEVLDRNLLAAMVSGALLLALQTAPRSALLHGALLGLLAGTGLRFLPTVFAVPVLLHHWPRDGERGSGWRMLGVGLGFLAAVAIALPHLAEHGLHSLGETASLPELLWLTLTQPSRAPLAPFAAGPLHALDALSRLGILGVACILAGALVLVRGDRRRAVGLLLPMGAVLLVLSVQRDWGQWDKLRIPLMLTVPAALLLGAFVDGLVRNTRTALCTGAAALALTAGCAWLLPQLPSPPDASARARHPVYATESVARLGPSRAALRPGFAPNVRRLATKTDWRRKRLLEQQLRATLFADGTQSHAILAAAGWDVSGSQPAAAPIGSPVTIEVDFEALMLDAELAVRLAPEATPWVDATSRKRLDVYHRAARVTWQPEELNLTVLPLSPAGAAMGEVVVEMDGFAAEGLDEDGLRRVVPIHLAGRANSAAQILRAMPDRETGARIAIRLGAKQRLVLRQWIIGLDTGSPHRVDSWMIVPQGDGLSVRYLLGEPESYL